MFHFRDCFAFNFPFLDVTSAGRSLHVPSRCLDIKVVIYSLRRLEVSSNDGTYDRGLCSVQITYRYIFLNLANKLFTVNITSVGI